VEDIVILGGPNGAGKTTAAQVVLPQQLDIREFVNADEIARGLSPFNPDGAALAAGRLMIGISFRIGEALPSKRPAPDGGILACCGDAEPKDGG
jgi:predicted ABC-type ATPase